MNTIDEMLKLYSADVSALYDDSRRDSLMDSLNDIKSFFSIVRLHIDLDAIRSSIDGEVRAEKAEIEEKGMSPSEAAEYLADRISLYSCSREMRHVDKKRINEIGDRLSELSRRHREGGSTPDEHEQSEEWECIMELLEKFGRVGERGKKKREEALKRYMGED